jgi:hypothetical protein
MLGQIKESGRQHMTSNNMQQWNYTAYIPLRRWTMSKSLKPLNIVGEIIYLKLD